MSLSLVGRKISKTKKANGVLKQLKAKKELFGNPTLCNALKNDPIINGLLLSDGSISSSGDGRSINSRFTLVQSPKHKSLIYKTQKHLKKLGFKSNITKYKSTFTYTRKRDNKKIKKTYYLMALQSKANIFFTELHHLWYIKQISKKNTRYHYRKIIPTHLKINQKTLAWWFMGDGTCSWMKNSVKKSKINISTESFTLFEVKKLIDQIKKLGIEQVLVSKHIDAYTIHIGKSSEVSKFLQLVESHIIRGFRYKIKKPFVRSREEGSKIGPSKAGKKRISEAHLGKKLTKKHVKKLKTIHLLRIKKRQKQLRGCACYICKVKKSREISKRTGYPIWRRHPEKPDKIICSLCYSRIYEKTRRKRRR